MLVVFAVCCLASPARAVDKDTFYLDEWTPAEVMPGAWTPLEPDSSVVPTDSRSCRSRWDRTWVRGGRPALRVGVWQCPTEKMASTLPDALAEGDRDGSSAFEGNDLASWTDGRALMLRSWAQGNLAVRVVVLCDSEAAPCPESSIDIARSVSARMPGEVLPPRNFASSVVTFVVNSVLVAWLVFVVAFRLVSRLAEERLDFPSRPPDFIDVGPVITRYRWQRGTRRALGLLQVIAVLAVLGWGAQREWVVVFLSVFIFVACQLGRRRLDDPLFHPSMGGSARSGWLRWGGWVLALITWAVAIVIIGWLLIVLLLISIVRYGLVPLNELEGADEAIQNPEFFALLAIGGFVVLGLLDRLGQRLRTRSAHEAMVRDGRPPILFLRSFDEDRLKIKASLSRLGVMERLSPLRRRRFEELMVRHLGRFGPVIAISPPGTRLPPLGSARMTLSNDEWQGRVEELASQAAAVVMSVTPASVREGFAWEIELAATRLGHGRLVLVVPPRRRRTVASRWADFVQIASYWPLFRALSSQPLPSGTHLITYVGDGAWRYWGNRRRWDWSYAVAIDRAVGASFGAWFPPVLDAAAMADKAGQG